MSSIVAIDLISFAAVVAAFAGLARGWHRPLSYDIKLLVSGLLGLYLFQQISNILEWGGISDALDPFEDFVELLVPIFWFILFYIYFKELAADELRQSRQALQKSEERFRVIFEKAAAGMLIVDTKERKYTKVNPAFRAMSGYTSGELLSMGPENLTHEGDWAIEKNLLSDLLAGNRSQYQLEKRYKKKEGGYFWGAATVALAAIASESPDSTITFVQDITERKKAEKALLESEKKLARVKKMESLGLLAGGVAHDLNNVLAGIVSYPELILMDLPENSKFRKPIETMQKSGHRAAAIVQDLLTVARGVAIAKEPVNLNQIVADYMTSPEFERLQAYHPAVSVQRSLDEELRNLNGSADHIRKALMNLVSNAFEAVGASGRVTVSTLNRRVDAPIRGYTDIDIGEYVLLTVADDGPGISSGGLSRIFEPFYTKKVMGRSGTGLGLAVVWNIVQDHNGGINLTTGPNGSAFELYFPATADDRFVREPSVSAEDFQGNGETILVVDDVESQREISCRMLETLGYRAVSVSSGEEAVAYMAERRADLILLDMIMDPGISGLETYERIVERHPRQKAIIVSGYAETEDVRQAQNAGAGPYLKKPLTLAKLAMAVKKELSC